MSFVSKSLTILSFFFPISVLAASTTTIQATNTEGFTSAQNLVKNQGFEFGTRNWTASAGTFTTSSSSPIRGSLHGSWDSSAAAQTLTGDAVTIPSSLFGANLSLSCLLRCVSGTCTHTLQAFDGTNNLGSATITSVTSGAARTTISFIGPSSGTLAPRFTSVASNEPELLIDDCVIARADALNLSQVSQASRVGSAYIATTASCNWSRTNTALGVVGTTAACPGPTVETNPGPGTVQTTDADLPRFTVNNLAPGEYTVIMSGYIASSASADCTAAINDGTTTSGNIGFNPSTTTAHPVVSVGHFSYSTTANRTFDFYLSSSTGTLTLLNANGQAQTRFSIFRWPNASEAAFRPDQSPASWSGYHDNTCSWARTNTAYGDPTADASCALVERTNRNFGTVSTSGSVLPAITFTPPRVGRYWVCARPKIAGGTLTSFVDARLTDGTTTITEAETQTDVVNDIYELNLCGIYNASAITSVTLSVQTKASAGSVTIATNATNASALEWSIIQIDAALSAPVLVGSVTSNSTGIERSERATIANAGTPSISLQSGTWLTSVTDNGTGDTTLNIAAGIFSGIPSCVCSSNTATSSFCVIDTTTAVSSTAVRIATRTDAGTVTDVPFSVNCQGPR